MSQDSQISAKQVSKTFITFTLGVLLAAFEKNPNKQTNTQITSEYSKNLWKTTTQNRQNNDLNDKW